MGIGEVGRRGIPPIIAARCHGTPGIPGNFEGARREAGQRPRSVLRTFHPWKTAFDPSLFQHKVSTF